MDRLSVAVRRADKHVQATEVRPRNQVESSGEGTIETVARSFREQCQAALESARKRYFQWIGAHPSEHANTTTGGSG